MMPDRKEYYKTGDTAEVLVQAPFIRRRACGRCAVQALSRASAFTWMGRHYAQSAMRHASSEHLLAV